MLCHQILFDAFQHLHRHLLMRPVMMKTAMTEAAEVLKSSFSCIDLLAAGNNTIVG